VRTPSRLWAVILCLALAYFILYPQDLGFLVAPFERILVLSGAVSPWLYGLLAVALLCWTALRICGRRQDHPKIADMPPT
jgi:hypothetical protein